jgi:CRP-like cAMP-binding protein
MTTIPTEGFLLLEGQVKISITSSSGREVVLDVLGSGEIIGELSAIDGLRVPMSQSDLAAWAGLSREAVVKALRTLRALGWIESRGRDIVLLDVNAILQRAEPAG